MGLLFSAVPLVPTILKGYHNVRVFQLEVDRAQVLRGLSDNSHVVYLFKLRLVG
jgi:hypothetical protein